jgi:hypothetical protein
VLNVTVTESEAAGYLTAYPYGTQYENGQLLHVPLASTLNFVQGQTVVNVAIVAPGRT